MHIHLDLVGGIAGDMFIAAMSNAFPELKLRIERVIAEANFSGVSICFESKNDGVLVGTHFQVTEVERSHVQHDEHLHGDSQTHTHEHEHSHDFSHLQAQQHNHEHKHPHDFDHLHTHEHHEHSAHEHPHDFDHLHTSQHHQHAPEPPSVPGDKPQYENVYAKARNHGHAHRTYEEIRQILTTATLPERVREHSLNIFRIIGEAEAEVHGVPVELISFHEVGGWDSVVDVIGAACAIEYADGATWSCSSLPKGGGFIDSAHGKLPVPPPAVALILRGFVFHDDGVLGERITPTGAAILKYLNPSLRLPSALELKGVGNGFGTKKLPSLSNVLRVLFFQSFPTEQQPIALLNFEIDDMTGEELAICLDNLRAAEGVLDVTQSTVYGKKNRLVMSVQVLAKVELQEQVVNLILGSTTTLGVRQQIVSRTVLARELKSMTVGDSNVRVKVAERPGGAKTAKVDIDDLSASSANCHDMRKLANAAEKTVLKETNDEHN
ncbi:MAG: LarC family nickel insertion protein [Candidatus Obscuribacterales bacterium]